MSKIFIHLKYESYDILIMIKCTFIPLFSVEFLWTISFSSVCTDLAITDLITHCALS